MFLKRIIQWYGMLCYPILCYGIESMVCYEISMLCYEISMLVYVVKDKHSPTVHTKHCVVLIPLQLVMLVLNVNNI